MCRCTPLSLSHPMLISSYFILITVLLEISCFQYEPISVHSKYDQIDEQYIVNVNGVNQSYDDTIILSTWQSLRVWSSNSSLHSTRNLLNFDALDKHVSSPRKITAIDFYQQFCDTVFVWCDVTRQSIYSAVLTLNNTFAHLTNVSAIVRRDFGAHVRLAVDRVHRVIYIAIYESHRIDFYQINNSYSGNLLSNVTRPVDIAVDSDLHILYWIENWTCISQLIIANMSVTRLCEIKPRALAVHSSQLYWCDSDGNILVKNYYSAVFNVVASIKKLKQTYAMDISDNVIYVSDQYKLVSLSRATKLSRVVLIESPGILGFKVMNDSANLKNCVNSQNRDSDLILNNATQNNESLVSNKTTIITTSLNMTQIDNMTNMYEKYFNYLNVSNFSEQNFRSYSTLYIIMICLILIICLSLLSLGTYFVIVYCRRVRHRLRSTKIETNESRNQLIVTENRPRKTFGNKRNVNKTNVCIEDLGSFGNNYLDPQWMCSNCPIKQTCSSCDDKQECVERGICLNTYKLLT